MLADKEARGKAKAMEEAHRKQLRDRDDMIRDLQQERIRSFELRQAALAAREEFRDSFRDGGRDHGGRDGGRDNGRDHVRDVGGRAGAHPFSKIPGPAPPPPPPPPNAGGGDWPTMSPAGVQVMNS